MIHVQIQDSERLLIERATYPGCYQVYLQTKPTLPEVHVGPLRAGQLYEENNKQEDAYKRSTQRGSKR